MLTIKKQPKYFMYAKYIWKKLEVNEKLNHENKQLKNIKYNWKAIQICKIKN